MELIKKRYDTFVLLASVIMYAGVYCVALASLICATRFDLRRVILLYFLAFIPNTYLVIHIILLCVQLCVDSTMRQWDVV